MWNYPYCAYLPLEPFENESLSLYVKIEEVIRDLDNVTEYVMDDNYPVAIVNEDLQRNLEQKLSLLFRNLYEQCIKDNFYWQFCPFKVYESNYQVLVNQFFSSYPDAIESDFIVSEIQEIIGVCLSDNDMEISYQLFSYAGGFYLTKCLDQDELKKIEFSQKRKLEFLKNKLESLNQNTTNTTTQKEIEPEYFNLTLLEFLDTITCKKKEYELVINKDSLTGTLDQINEFVNNLDDDTFNLIRPHLSGKKEYTTEFELSEIEIYNYLEKVSDNFDPSKVKLILAKVEVYYIEMKDEILKNGREYCKQNSIGLQKINTENDIDIYYNQLIENNPKKRNEFGILFSIALLEKKLNENKLNFEKTHSVSINDNPHPQIFKNKTAFELFEHMQETVKDELADYSFIYRVMLNDKYIIPEVTPTNFKKWLYRIYQIELPKVKTLTDCETISKNNTYKTAKQLYKP